MLMCMRAYMQIYTPHLANDIVLSLGKQGRREPARARGKNVSWAPSLICLYMYMHATRMFSPWPSLGLQLVSCSAKQINKEQVTYAIKICAIAASILQLRSGYFCVTAVELWRCIQ